MEQILRIWERVLQHEIDILTNKSDCLRGKFKQLVEHEGLKFSENKQASKAKIAEKTRNAAKGK